jgi:hypothetical protein
LCVCVCSFTSSRAALPSRCSTHQSNEKALPLLFMYLLTSLLCYFRAPHDQSHVSFFFFFTRTLFFFVCLVGVASHPSSASPSPFSESLFRGRSHTQTHTRTRTRCLRKPILASSHQRGCVHACPTYACIALRRTHAIYIYIYTHSLTRRHVHSYTQTLSFS